MALSKEQLALMNVISDKVVKVCEETVLYTLIYAEEERGKLDEDGCKVFDPKDLYSFSLVVISKLLNDGKIKLVEVDEDVE